MNRMILLILILMPYGFFVSTVIAELNTHQNIISLGVYSYLARGEIKKSTGNQVSASLENYKNLKIMLH
ncbi:MAG: hypothetical protein R3240_03135 [Gammaproteobacteria bacterium]|nr:hypothetical protein [Gammaproteobacteria bacterium]